MALYLQSTQGVITRLVIRKVGRGEKVAKIEMCSSTIGAIKPIEDELDSKLLLKSLGPDLAPVEQV